MTASFTTKSEFAYAAVRNKIITHGYAPGAVLNQAMLAQELGISTTPLREALRRLESERLVELGAHRDARVTQLSAEEARDLLEMRRALDPLAISLAAERRGPADIDHLRATYERLRPLPNRPDVADLVAHRMFHRALYAASHNEILIATLDGLWDKADRYRQAGLRDERSQSARDETAVEHKAMLTAVLAGDSRAAAEAMRAHIDGSLGAKALSTLTAAPSHD
ncbi:GntR family transcriptional regulator [Actinophytocola oryzae]|uniref:DNA-binding GntR family transcriptional regulator n=1 Tax=Actinophytocola oryzae TaxID=502181 RepID=A0A4R7VKH6_9PSEU|nr:GntR family transcriptional regulator [Actinophytocola oryzae]TDV49983.1 DNA-binding GntR family transcriptional regulator [Actinophytocola oryzae]